MFEDGLVAETERLLQLYGDTREVTAMHSLGYRQARQVLRDELKQDQAIADAQQGHRNYAKRQMTWFRREADVHWLEGFGDDPAIRDRATTMVQGVWNLKLET